MKHSIIVNTSTKHFCIKQSYPIILNLLHSWERATEFVSKFPIYPHTLHRYNIVTTSMSPQLDDNVNIIARKQRCFLFYGDNSIMRLGPMKARIKSSRAELRAHKYESAVARMLFYDHVYTSDRAELRIVSQTLRELSLHSRSNSVDSEDRRMIDGISKANHCNDRIERPPVNMFFFTFVTCIASRIE